MSKWNVQGGRIPYIIDKSLGYPNYRYLCPDGTIHPAGEKVNYSFLSWKEAEEFLRNWKGSNMVDDKISQCKKDIEKLQEQLTELEEEKKNSEHYTIGWDENEREIGFFVTEEIIEYIQEHEGDYVWIETDGDCSYENGDDPDNFEEFTTTRFRKGD